MLSQSAPGGWRCTKQRSRFLVSSEVCTQSLLASTSGESDESKWVQTCGAGHNGAPLRRDLRRVFMAVKEQQQQEKASAKTSKYKGAQETSETAKKGKNKNILRIYHCCVASFSKSDLMDKWSTWKAVQCKKFFYRPCQSR